MLSPKGSLTYSFLTAIFVGGAITIYTVASNYPGTVTFKLNTDGVFIEINGGNIRIPKLEHHQKF
jgi:hypothetical protein